MKKLVIIGANDFQNQLILKAKSLGYETHVFAWEDGAVGKNNADYFYPISVMEKCKEIKPDGVRSVGCGSISWSRQTNQSVLFWLCYFYNNFLVIFYRLVEQKNIVSLSTLTHIKYLYYF